MNLTVSAVLGEAVTAVGAASPAGGAIDVGNVLLALIVGGLLGTVGQGVRAIAGLKKMSTDSQNKGLNAGDLFSPRWFFVSLTIGFIAGVIATLTLGLDKVLKVDPNNIQVMLGIAAAGYAGTDFIEAFASQFSGGLLPPAATAADRKQGGATAAGGPRQPPTVTPPRSSQSYPV